MKWVRNPHAHGCQGGQAGDAWTARRMARCGSGDDDLGACADARGVSANDRTHPREPKEIRIRGETTFVERFEQVHLGG